MLSGLLGGLVGAVTVPITLVRWNSGLTVGLVAFIAAAIGRFTSPARTVAAGLALGVIESMASGLISSQYRSAYVYGVLVVYLLLEDALGHDGLISRLRARWASPAGAVAGGDDRPVLVTAGGAVGADGAAARARWRTASVVPVLLLLLATLIPILVDGSRPATRRSSRCSAQSRPPGS